MYSNLLVLWLLVLTGSNDPNRNEASLSAPIVYLNIELLEGSQQEKGAKCHINYTGEHNFEVNPVLSIPIQAFEGESPDYTITLKTGEAVLKQYSVELVESASNISPKPHELQIGLNRNAHPPISYERVSYQISFSLKNFAKNDIKHWLTVDGEMRNSWVNVQRILQIRNSSEVDWGRHSDRVIVTFRDAKGERFFESESKNVPRKSMLSLSQPLSLTMSDYGVRFKMDAKTKSPLMKSVILKNKADADSNRFNTIIPSNSQLVLPHNFNKHTGNTIEVNVEKEIQIGNLDIFTHCQESDVGLTPDSELLIPVFPIPALKTAANALSSPKPWLTLFINDGKISYVSARRREFAFDNNSNSKIDIEILPAISDESLSFPLKKLSVSIDAHKRATHKNTHKRLALVDTNEHTLETSSIFDDIKPSIEIAKSLEENASEILADESYFKEVYNFRCTLMQLQGKRCELSPDRLRVSMEEARKILRKIIADHEQYLSNHDDISHANTEIEKLYKQLKSLKERDSDKYNHEIIFLTNKVDKFKRHLSKLEEESFEIRFGIKAIREAM